MKNSKIFQVAGLLSLFLFAFVFSAMAQTDPTIGPDSGTNELVAYFNYLTMGLQAAATLIIGYVAKYIPGLKAIPDKFLRILAAAMVVALFLFLAIGGGKSIWELISPLIGFITATGLIYPGVLKPLGAKS